jgi:hypothetical protein
MKRMLYLLLVGVSGMVQAAAPDGIVFKKDEGAYATLRQGSWSVTWLKAQNRFKATTGSDCFEGYEAQAVWNVLQQKYTATHRSLSAPDFPIPSPSLVKAMKHPRVFPPAATGSVSAPATPALAALPSPALPPALTARPRALTAPAPRRWSFAGKARASIPNTPILFFAAKQAGATR